MVLKMYNLHSMYPTGGCPLTLQIEAKKRKFSFNLTLFVRLTEQDNFLSENVPDRARFIGFCHLRR